MMNNNSLSHEGVVITRYFDAPRDLVFKVWTDPEHIAQWWGPHGFSIPFCEMDVRAGGKIQITMVDADGNLYPNKGHFVEITPPERLVYVLTAFEDEHGITGLEVQQTVTFTEEKGKTKLVLQVLVLKAVPEVALPLSGMDVGWNQSFNKLERYITKMTTPKKGNFTISAPENSLEVVMTRFFDAPIDLVFNAFIDPEKLKRWWGPAEFTTVVEKLDAQRGGQWRFIQKGGDGSEFAFRGVFHEVNAPYRIVQTFEFEGMEGHILLETIQFEDRDGKTYMVDQSVFQSVADRDGMYASGMEEGSAVGFDRLEDYLNNP